VCVTRQQTKPRAEIGEGRLTTVRVKVDRDRCQGHARCAALAGELFRLDDLGNAQEIGDGIVPEALIEKAYLAKANCPELAIEVTET
jgi:ferredoxin